MWVRYLDMLKTGFLLPCNELWSFRNQYFYSGARNKQVAVLSGTWSEDWHKKVYLGSE